MHIAIDARIISSTSGRYVERLLHYLEKVDTTNQYTVMVPTEDLSYWKPTNPHFTVIAADFDNYSFAEQIGFYHFIKNLKADLVHFCMPQQPLLYRGKKVTTFHDMTLVKTWNSDKNWFIYHTKQLVGKFVFRKAARDSDHIITITKNTSKELVDFAGISDDKITVTYEAGEVRTTASRSFKLPYKQYILYVGKQSDYKNIKRLGDAHQELLRRFPDLGLVLAGGKNVAVLANENYFNKKKYKNIFFTDFVEDDQLNWLYAHATAYVFPSLMEGFGLPGLEAMSHGTPVISSNASCLPEVHGDAAHYFNPLSVPDMARAIGEVVSNEKLRTKLSAAGYQRIKKFSWKKMAEQTHKVYMDVLKTKN